MLRGLQLLFREAWPRKRMEPRRRARKPPALFPFFPLPVQPRPCSATRVPLHLARVISLQPVKTLLYRERYYLPAARARAISMRSLWEDSASPNHNCARARRTSFFRERPMPRAHCTPPFSLSPVYSISLQNAFRLNSCSSRRVPKARQVAQGKNDKSFFSVSSRLSLLTASRKWER